MLTKQDLGEEMRGTKEQQGSDFRIPSLQEFYPPVISPDLSPTAFTSAGLQIRVYEHRHLGI